MNNMNMSHLSLLSTMIVRHTIPNTIISLRHISLSHYYYNSTTTTSTTTSTTTTNHDHPYQFTQSRLVPSIANGTTLRRFLTKDLCLPISLVHRLLRHNKITVSLPSNGPNNFTTTVDLTLKLETGTTVMFHDPHVMLPEFTTPPNPTTHSSSSSLQSSSFMGKFIPKHIRKQINDSIIYQDDKVIAINKPSGVLVHGGTMNHLNITKYSIADMAYALCPSNSSYIPAPVHRIDKSTSGIVLLAKNRETADELSKSLRERTLLKEYIALLAGRVNPASGIIQCDLYRGQVPQTDPNRPGQVSPTETMHDRTLVATQLKPPPPNTTILSSETKYRILACNNSTALSVIKLIPMTGRKHQLRSVCQYVLNAPIVGDYKYGYRDDNRRRNLHLHLHRLTLPWGGVTIVAPIPDYMIKTCRTGNVTLPKSILN